MWGAIGDFFGSLFGGNKKKKEEQKPTPSSSIPRTTPTVNISTATVSNPFQQQIQNPLEVPRQRQSPTLPRGQGAGVVPLELQGYDRPKTQAQELADNIARKQREENRRNTNLLAANTAVKAIQEGPKAIANLPALFAEGFNWLGDSSRRLGQSLRHNILGTDEAQREAERQALNAKLESTPNLARTVSRGWSSGVDELSERVGLNDIIRSTEAERERNIRDLVRSQGHLTEGQKGAAVLGELIGTVSDPLNLIPFGATTRGLSRVSRAVNPRELTTSIPVRSDINIRDITPEEIAIAVRNQNTPQSLIQDVSGGARTTADGLIPRQQPVTLPRTSNRMDDIRLGSTTSPDTITRAELNAEIAAVRADSNLTTAQKNDIIKQLEESGGNLIPIRRQVSVDTEAEIPVVPKSERKNIRESQQGDKTITQQEVEKMKQSQEAEAAGIQPSQLDGMTPQDRESTLAAIQNQRVVQSPEIATQLDELSPNISGSDLDFLRSINPVTQGNLSAARQAIRNVSKVRSADRASRNAAMRRAVEDARARGASSEEIDRVRQAALRGEYAKTEYRGQGIGEEAEQRLISIIDEDPDLAGQEFTKLNITRAFRNLYHTGEPGYPNTIQKADLRNIGQYLNRKVPSMGDAFEEAVKELDKVPDANIATQIFAVPRSAVASADVGGIGRQAFPLGLMNPVEFKNAIKTSFKGMFSQKNYNEAVKAITRDKDYYFITDDLKVSLPSIRKDFTDGEQFAASNLAEKIPALGPVIRASQRQYELLLTELRYNVAKKYVQKNGGIDGINRAANDTGNPEVFKAAFGDYVNTFSGKSDIGGIIKKNPQAMHSLFFSAPNLASKIQRLNPAYYIRLHRQNPQAAKLAATNAAIHMATVGSVIAGAASLGLVENGRIKIGNTRYDVTGGLASLLTAGAKMYQAMDSPKDGIFSKTASDEFGQFLRNQLNPSIALFLNHFDTTPKDEDGGIFDIDRVTKYGEEYNSLAEFTKGSLVPLSIQSIFDDINQGVPAQQIAANLIAEIVGIGVNTYESGDDRRAREADEFSASAGPLEKYLPEGQREYTEDVLTNISDTAFYNSDWEAFTEARRQQLEMAKSSKSSTKAKRDKAELELKRAQFYEEMKDIPPSLIDAYQDIGVEQWRKMGIPEGEKGHDPELYNPELYSELQALDQLMKERGISYNTTGGKGPKFNKYTTKAPTGPGGRARNQFSGLSSATLNWGRFMPNIQEYSRESLMPSAAPPTIRAVNPRIRHKITQS